MFRIFFVLLIIPNILLAVKSKEELKRLTSEIQKEEAAGEKLFNEQRMKISQSNNTPQRCYSDTALLRHLMKKNNKSIVIKSK